MKLKSKDYTCSLKQVPLISLSLVSNDSKTNSKSKGGKIKRGNCKVWQLNHILYLWQIHHVKNYATSLTKKNSFVKDLNEKNNCHELSQVLTLSISNRCRCPKTIFSDFITVWKSCEKKVY